MTRTIFSRLVACALLTVPLAWATTTSNAHRAAAAIAQGNSAMPVARPDTPPGFAAFERRYDSLAALVDTIVILSPDSVVLRLGQAISLLDTVRFEGRRRSGEVVKVFASTMESEDGSIAQNIETGFTGLKVGTTRIAVRVTNSRSRRGPTGIWAAEREGIAGARPPHAISYIPVRVIP